MKDRSLGIIGRLLKVLIIGILIISSVHFGARLAWMVLPTYSYDYEEKTIWNYWDYASEAPMFVVLTHLVGAALTLVCALVLSGVPPLLRYIARGRKPYVDPCPDNRRCPCPRHRVEEENARAARMAAMTAATTAAVTTTIIN